jgi:uroporphyrinogen decarboxylase
VESRDDWEQMKERYNADDPARFPEDFADRVRKLEDRDYPSCIWDFPGPFWQMREWLGFEGLCMKFIDDTEMIQDMVDFWGDFVLRVVERLFKDYVPDLIMVSEDMAYKMKSMISPAMARQYLLPVWTKWGELCKSVDLPIYAIDSDGYTGNLMDLWVETGFNCNFPMEVAAGNDLPAIRKQYGKKMAFLGGVDKRAMAKGGKTIRDEIDRLKPVIDSGGYIPGCDHGVPADVSWPNFVEYCKLLAQVTGWL